MVVDFGIESRRGHAALLKRAQGLQHIREDAGCSETRGVTDLECNGCDFGFVDSFKGGTCAVKKFNQGKKVASTLYAGLGFKRRWPPGSGRLLNRVLDRGDLLNSRGCLLSCFRYHSQYGLGFGYNALFNEPRER